MKIGIVTFFRNANYGAMLQALALWKYLESRGHEVKFIEGAISQPMKLCGCISRSWSEMKRRFRRYVREKCTTFAASYPVGTVNERYDVIVVGSDQMWNPTWMLPKLSFVFLSFAHPGCKRISYAVSFGVRRWGDVCRDEVSTMLARFDAISVRESSGVSIVKDLCGRSAEVLPDPTLLWDGEYYRRLSAPEFCGSNNKRYVFSFMLDEWGDGEMEKACAVAAAKSIGVEEVRLAYDYGEFPLSLICRVVGIRAKLPVSQWLSLMDGATIVVTNSFHGMVFAILFRKPFVVIKHRGAAEQMNDRVETTLRMLGIEGRSVYANESHLIEGVIKNEIDWRKVEESIVYLRCLADAYFMKVGI